MKTTKILLSIFCSAMLACALASCGNAPNSNSPATANTKSNTATAANSNQTAVNTTAANTNAFPPANAAANKTAANANANKTADKTASTGKFSAETIFGELEVGKTESVILYVGEETGDYAAYCFPNDSDTGRTILAACKDGQQCQVQAVVGDGVCKVPGLEATLSASGRLTKVESVKVVGKK